VAQAASHPVILIRSAAADAGGRDPTSWPTSSRYVRWLGGPRAAENGYLVGTQSLRKPDN
jgi:hypothetical protein